MNKLYWYWLRNLKYTQIEKLLSHAGSFEALFREPALIAQAKCGLRKTTIDRLIATANEDALSEAIRAVEKQHISVVCFDDPDYPQLLRNIYDPPRILYVRGALSRLSERTFAIVGTRSGTRSGLITARKIAKDLSAAGISIVSGMARGMDTAAAIGAIEGKTPCAAVLGCGVDVVYPRENQRLYDKICETGVVISEYPPGAAPIPGNFPPRNRIINGICPGVLIVEGEMKSGAAITMRCAVEENREVFAIPGDLNSPFSVLPNALIAEGAVVTLSADTVLGHFGWEQPEMCAQTEKFLPNLDFSENELYTLLKWGDADLDFLVAQTGKTVAELSMTLMSLELKGIVVRLPGNRYSIKR